MVCGDDADDDCNSPSRCRCRRSLYKVSAQRKDVLMLLMLACLLLSSKKQVRTVRMLNMEATEKGEVLMRMMLAGSSRSPSRVLALVPAACRSGSC